MLATHTCWILSFRRVEIEFPILNTANRDRSRHRGNAVLFQPFDEICPPLLRPELSHHVDSFQSFILQNGLGGSRRAAVEIRPQVVRDVIADRPEKVCIGWRRPLHAVDDLKLLKVMGLNRVTGLVQANCHFIDTSWSNVWCCFHILVDVSDELIEGAGAAWAAPLAAGCDVSRYPTSLADFELVGLPEEHALVCPVEVTAKNRGKQEEQKIREIHVGINDYQLDCGTNVDISK